MLGMHRSGTSCLAGCLERSRLHFGRVSRHARFNARGYHEQPEVMRVNEQALALSGGRWDAPPADCVVHPRLMEHMSAVAGELLESTPWGINACGIKDPRMVLLLDQWVEAIGAHGIADVALAGSFRHPEAVAGSLATRDGMDRERALGLWLAYNRRLVDRHSLSPFPLVEYDLSDPVAYCRRVAALARTLGLNPSLAHLRWFAAPELQHEQAAARDVDPSCRELWEYLRANAHTATDSCSSVGERRLGGELTESLKLAEGRVREAAFAIRRRLRARLARVGKDQ